MACCFPREIPTPDSSPEASRADIDTILRVATYLYLNCDCGASDSDPIHDASCQANRHHQALKAAASRLDSIARLRSQEEAEPLGYVVVCWLDAKASSFYTGVGTNRSTAERARDNAQKHADKNPLNRYTYTVEPVGARPSAEKRVTITRQWAFCPECGKKLECECRPSAPETEVLRFRIDDTGSIRVDGVSYGWPIGTPLTRLSEHPGEYVINRISSGPAPEETP